MPLALGVCYLCVYVCVCGCVGVCKLDLPACAQKVYQLQR